MSLIALTELLRAGRSMARTLMLLIALTGAVIVGLLAMHSLNIHTAAAETSNTHSVPAENSNHPSVAAENSSHPSVAAAASGTSTDDHHAGTAAADPCADCGTGHSGVITMACVLALLATVLLLARPVRAQQWLAVLARSWAPAVGPLHTLGSRPPSLSVLCISRT